MSGNARELARLYLAISDAEPFLYPDHRLDLTEQVFSDMLTDTDITEIWEAINRLSDRLDALEAAGAMRHGTMGVLRDSEPAVITPAEPNAPGLTEEA